MARSSSLERFARALKLARTGESLGITTAELLERAEEERALVSRRSVLIGGSALAAAAFSRPARATPRRRTAGPDVAIVGAGLAGLSCAYELEKAGIVPTIYEATGRVGGRQLSLRGHFSGQTVELGGELIDNLHKQMLGWARTFGLTLEDLGKEPGDIAYHFAGVPHDEAAVVDEFRAFVPRMREDLRRLSHEPAADAHTAADLDLDRTSLAEYLETRGAGPLAKAAIAESYVAEYGLEPEEQSALNFLLFMHADRRAKFTPFGIFSDERYHVVEGNDRIATGIASLLAAQPIFGTRLVAVEETAAGRVRLTLQQGTSLTEATHDAVVLAIPFSVLRTVQLPASLPQWKRTAIDRLGYGMNAKTMVGFTSRPWAAAGSNGAAYSDLEDVQTTWESSPRTANASHAVLCDYAGGARGAALRPANVSTQADRFVTDLDRIYPGAAIAARRTSSGPIDAVLQHWPTVPETNGSYTCYRPGQFCSIAGNEAKQVGNLFFAGEHTNSFYEWQGFMEGALLSGITAAAQLRGR